MSHLACHSLCSRCNPCTLRPRLVLDLIIPDVIWRAVGARHVTGCGELVSLQMILVLQPDLPTLNLACLVLLVLLIQHCLPAIPASSSEIWSPAHHRPLLCFYSWSSLVSKRVGLVVLFFFNAPFSAASWSELCCLQREFSQRGCGCS